MNTILVAAAAFAAVNSTDQPNVCIKIFRQAMDYGETGIDSDEAPGVHINVLEDTRVTSWWERGGKKRGQAEWVVPNNMRECDEYNRILFLHGGGYSSYSPSDLYRALTTRIAALTGLPVLAIDYRLVPEHPFPAGVQDALDGMEWIQANGPHGPSRAKKVFVIGDSAGAGLAVSLQLAQISGTLDGTAPLSKKQRTMAHAVGTVLYSVYTDLTCSLPSYTTRVWVQETMTGDPIFSNGNTTEDYINSVACGQAYVNEGVSKYTLVNPIASPYWAKDEWLKQLPDSLLIVGDAELMLDDTVVFAEKVKQAGNQNVYRSSVYDRMWHDHVFYTEGCVNEPDSLEQATQALQESAAFILERL